MKLSVRKTFLQARLNARKSSRARSVLLYAGGLACILALSANPLWGLSDPFEEHHPRRQLASSVACDYDSLKEWKKQGGFLVYVIGILYMFVGIAIVCDDFFVASLEAISEALQLSEDVAGATFMAAGSSAPELFSSIVAISSPAASEALGVGTIVGSAVFNILMIIGATAVSAGEPLDLDWWPLTRDAIFYFTAVLSIMFVFMDGVVYWYEGLVFFLLYIVYIGFMSQSQRLGAHARKLLARTKVHDCTDGPEADKGALNPEGTSNGDEDTKVGQLQVLILPLLWSALSGTIAIAVYKHAEQYPCNYIHCYLSCSCSVFCLSFVSMVFQLAATEDVEGEAPEEEEAGSPFTPPDRLTDYPMWILSVPWYIAYTCTIPPCNNERWAKYYMISFLMSIAWIGVISWFMVEWAAAVGCILHVPNVVMGVTVLAAGTSIPDCIASLVVAKQGMGDMAIANAIGSNIFDIWLGLGAPWMVILAAQNRTILMNKSGLLTWVFILLGVLVAYFCSIVLSGWRITPRIGYMLITLYFGFATFNIVTWILNAKQPQQ